MYEVSLISGAGRIELIPSNGYYVANIDGLTGISSSIATVQNVDGTGQSVTGKVIESKTLTITGYILDQQTVRKNALIALCRPGEAMTVQISASETGSKVIRRTQCYVKESPIISQERHSLFVLTLFMPVPYWYGTSTVSFTPTTNTDGVLHEVAGDAEPPVKFIYRPSLSSGSSAVTLYYGHSQGYQDKMLRLDFSALDGGKLTQNQTVTVSRDNGKVKVQISSGTTLAANAIACAFTGSTLWYLPRGIGYYYVDTDGGVNTATVEYYPMYAGVLAYGV